MGACLRRAKAPPQHPLPSDHELPDLIPEPPSDDELPDLIDAPVETQMIFYDQVPLWHSVRHECIYVFCYVMVFLKVFVMFCYVFAMFWKVFARFLPGFVMAVALLFICFASCLLCFGRFSLGFC